MGRSTAWIKMIRGNEIRKVCNRFSREIPGQARIRENTMMGAMHRELAWALSRTVFPVFSGAYGLFAMGLLTVMVYWK